MMRELYNALWKKQVPAIQRFCLHIPYPTPGLQPGYTIGLHSTKNTLPPPQFEYIGRKKSFQKLDINLDLPCGMRKFIIRQEYENIYDLLVEAEVLKWSNFSHAHQGLMTSARLDYKIAGQPGAGKTCCLSYILARRLLNHQPTVYRINDDLCFLFNDKTQGEKISLGSLFALTKDEKRKIWILTDEALTHPIWNNKAESWFTILGASPAKVRLSYQWQKERNPGVRYIRPWSWEDIYAAYSMESDTPPTAEQARRLFVTFACLGPLSRTCLQTIDVNTSTSFNKSLKTYLGQIDLEIGEFVAQGGRVSLENSVHKTSSHKIAIMEPTEDGLSYHSRISTRWIAYRLYQTARKWSSHDSFLLYEQLSRQPQLRTAAGWFFEAYAHDWFRQGGTFHAQEIPVKTIGNQPFTFSTRKSTSLSENLFTTTLGLGNKVRSKTGNKISQLAINSYFLPYSPNLASVDALMFTDEETLVVFQITIALRHQIKGKGIKELLQSLPPTINKAMKLEDIVSTKSTNLTIKQFRLVFSDKDIQSIAVPGLCGHGGNDVEGEDTIGGDFGGHDFDRENVPRSDSYGDGLNRENRFGADPDFGDSGGGGIASNGSGRGGLDWDNAANAKLKLNGSMVGKKRLFVRDAVQKEERTQKLKLHFKKGRNGLRGDGKEPDPSNPESAHGGPSDSREEGGAEGTEKGEKTGNIEKEPPSSPPEKSTNHPEHGQDRDLIGESLEVSQLDEGIEQDNSTTGATIGDRPPLTPVENVPHIILEQDTTSVTRWRGTTQLTGITEVEEEEVATETAHGDNTAKYAEPALQKIQDHAPDAVSEQVHESNFHDQINDERLQGESAHPDSPRAFLEPSGSNGFHRQQHYDNRSPSPHNGIRGRGVEYHNHCRNGTGLGYRGYSHQNPSCSRGGFRFYGNYRPGGNGGHHQSFNNSPSGRRTVFFNNSTQAFSTESSYEPIGPQNQHRKKKFQGGNRNGPGGQQQRGSPAAIDHTVDNVMPDLSDTSQGQ